MRARILTGLALVNLVAGCSRELTAKEGTATLNKAFPDPAANPAIQFAVTAAQSNDFGQSILALQQAKQTPGLTAAQLQAVDEASVSMTRELLRRAESGDANAKATLQMIERTRSQ